jgi:hypothetical protein
MQEMSDLNEDFRSKVSTIYSRMKDCNGICGRGPGMGGSSAFHRHLRHRQFISTAGGAIMHMKLTKDGEPLRLFKQMVFERI